MALSDRFKDKITQSALEKDARDIYLEIKDLLNKNDEISKKRWVWELVQNACDNETETGIDIEVEFIENDNPYLEFRHNGRAFTEDDVIDLITQSSRKSLDKKDQNSSVGMYGTGFLSTHFLSTKVQISSTLTIDKEIKKPFEILLDRSGDVNDILTSITNVLELVDTASSQSSKTNDHSGQTIFKYPLTDDSIEIARIGLSSLERLIVNVFAFFPRLNSVKILHNSLSYWRNSTVQEGDFITIDVVKKDRDEESVIQVIKCQNGGLEGILKVDKESKKLIGIEPDAPRLYRYFPLIGSETFYCPIIINSHDFYPNKDRDGIAISTAQTDSVRRNKEVITNLPQIYSSLISYCLEKQFENTFHLADFPGKKNLEDIDSDWFKPIEEDLHDIILTVAVVRNTDNKFGKIKDETGRIASIIPWIDSKENREHFWKACNKTNLSLVHHDDFEEWVKRANIIGWSTKLPLILKWIASKKNLEDLKTSITSEETLQFLQMMIDLTKETEPELLNEHAFIPVRDGTLKKKNEVWRNNCDADLFIIAADNISSLPKFLSKEQQYFKKLNNRVIDDRLEFDESHKDIDNAQICNSIDRVRNVLLDHKNEPEYKDTLANLFNWMLSNEKLASELIPNLWNRRFDLKSSNEIKKAFEAEKKIKELENLGYDIEQLLSEESFSKEGELELNNDANTLSQGFKSIVNEVLHSGRSFEGANAFELFLKENHDLLTNIPKSDLDSYRKWLLLLKQAKDNIWGKLSNHERYDCSEWSTDKKYPTIVTGVKKHGYDMYIVVRPSKHGMVLFHDQIEYDILDLPNSELWIYDEVNGAREYRIGKLLSQFRISKIPVIS